MNIIFKILGCVLLIFAVITTIQIIKINKTNDKLFEQMYNQSQKSSSLGGNIIDGEIIEEKSER